MQTPRVAGHPPRTALVRTRPSVGTTDRRRGRMTPVTSSSAVTTLGVEPGPDGEATDVWVHTVNAGLATVDNHLAGPERVAAVLK